MEDVIQKLKQSIKESGWDSYKSLKNQLLSYNSKELIIKLITTKEFKNTDIRSLFVIVPELWKDFSLEDWKFIMRKVNRPTNYRLFIDDGPFFEDVRFLYNWIGIDSINLYKNDSLITKENKQALDKVFPLFLKDSLRNGVSDNNDFQDGTFGDINYFRKMKQRLISQGAKPSPIGDL